MIPLYLRAQNAGVVISKVSRDICFEAFELAPCNKAVITTKGRLRRSFPGSAFAVSQSTFDEDGFQDTLAKTIAKMSHLTAPNMQPKVRKAGQQHSENRDTTLPHLVTEHLMSFLRAAGKPAEPSTIWKNTREEVMWFNSLLPWRRSPFWLLVRVVMQLNFSRSAIPTKPPKDLYKAFMVFFLAHILGLSHRYALRSDTLYAMNAKLSRRLLKLGAEQAKPCINVVQHVMKSTHSLIETRWQDIIDRTCPSLDLLRLKSINFKDDVSIHLADLDDYIAIMAGRKMNTSQSVFEPTSVLPKYPRDDLPTSLGAFAGDYQIFNLAAFESWVDSDLPGWLDRHISHATTCGRLRNLIEMYHSSAALHYAANPEASSIMILTIMELWVACDKSASTLYELLQDYDPEIPVELLQSLLLPFKSQMKRLSDVEQYLKSRQSNAKGSSPPLLRSFGHPSAFSVRYFDQSSEHQTLFSSIDASASREREEKCTELSRKKAEYWSLMRLHDQSECEYYEVIVDDFNDFRDTRHSGSCKKCQYRHQAASITIEVHEWPLPSSQIKAKSTVFELMVPASFSGWRDATIFLVKDVLGCDYSEKDCPRARHTLQNYQGLSSFFQPSGLCTQRVGLLSEVKPHVNTHRRDKTIADTTEGEVCLENGLRCQYHDCEEEVFIKAFVATDRVLELCTYRLPQRSSSLQKFLARPPSMPSGLPPNRVIASQADCPDHISLDEFKAFCALPLGYRIQWMNILAQLSIPSLDFTKVETNILLLQIIYQAGPPGEGDVGRSSHKVLADETFGHAILIQLQIALQRVKENWESLRALASFIHLASRLLSLAPSSKIQDKCLKYLEKAREVAFGWVNLLQDKAQRSTDETQRTEFLLSTVEVAMICINTFDVDQRCLDNILASPPEASIFIQCSITIQEYSCSTLGQRDPLLYISRERWKNLSYRAIHMLTREVVEIGSLCLNDAIKKSWSDYQAGSSWQSITSPYEHWVSCKTASQLHFAPLSVHFNLLTAELLVNSVPLALLPSKYGNHPTYTMLFGHSTLEVMPTRLPGMEFSAKKAYADYTLHFGMQSILSRHGSSGSDLLLHAVQDDRKYDLLPSRLFEDKFPVAFVNDFVHWYDHAGNSIELRPMEDLWSSSPANWRLTRVGPSWRLARDGVALASMSSNTVQVLSGILSVLEEPLHIHTFFHETSGSLDVELPRLQLGFTLKPGASLIYSREFRGMSIDSNQGIGTLVGLRNKLVLKQDDGGHDRLVIIPEGRVTYQTNYDHVIVSIDRNSAVKAHSYHVDKRLGRIVDNGNLQSQLFLCYLHGLTSYCLPDLLTLRTGTEQALSILVSAAVRSFDCLTKENLAILERIAKLAAGRTYYPANERVMQQVDWDSRLSFLSQHSSFYKYVEDIFVQANDEKLFHFDSYIEPPRLDFVTTHLLERDLIRSSAFRVSDFGAEQHTGEHDTEYFPRDRGQNSDRATRTFVAASLIFQRQAILHVNVLSDFRASLWKRLNGQGTIEGPKRILDHLSLTFDPKWLEVPSNHLDNLWCRIHLSLSQASHNYNNFHIAMWLSTTAFAQNADMQMIQTLAAFYNIPDVARITAAPAPTVFNLSEGAGVDSSELEQLIRRARRPLHSCPEASLPRQVWESGLEARQRRLRQFQSNQDKAISNFASALELQWPCEVPQTPIEDTFSTYLTTGQAMKEIKLKFKTWFQNYHLYEYLGRIEDALRCQSVDPISTPAYVFTISQLGVEERTYHVSVDDIFATPAPSMLPKAPTSLNVLVSTELGVTQTKPRLGALLADLEAQLSTKYERDYIVHLRDSLLSLQGRAKKNLLDSQGCDTREVLECYLVDCNQYVRELYSAMTNLVGENQTAHAMAATVRQWPRVSPALFLRQLTLIRWKRLPDAWKEWIIKYGLALTELQRAERLVTLSDNPVDLTDELLNTGHRNWNPSDFPDSLLLEVESGIMIREVQEEIARQMRAPSSNENAVMQLNMGEGKSSVIVPMVAAALADGTRLVRVIVAKPQSKQMFQMLISKLGGLLDRRIYHMPFSRSLRLEVSQADTIGKIYRDCIVNRGILLVQPEQILSFKLMCLECLATGDVWVGRSLLQTQYLFDTKSRDIVDESDENFSIKFELIYTIGMQRPIEFSPERWTIIQTVLALVARFALDVKRDLPLSIKFDDRWLGRFPRIRILRPDANELILKRIAYHICKTGFSGFPVARQPEEVRQSVFKYITKSDLTAEEIARVESDDKGSFWTDTTRNHLLLIRGLIAGGVLSFAFGSKRWRVNYGLDLNRSPKTKLAVPFRAKDNPTTRSEFSHPDVLIALTLLSYYYGGLEDDDLFIAFSHLLKSDQAEIEYGEWVRTAPDLSDAFHQLVGINIKDRFQCINQVFPHLRYGKGVIDYFLSHIVFPKEMKEFPHKLSASGWDIGQIKSHPTTGFSGTNDSRHVLPLSVQHLDLPEQKHTNALVLESLLRDENSVELLPPGDESTGSDAELLLAMIIKMDPAVRVILDVGAQILELSNLQVAEEWLKIRTNDEQTKAVIFFNDRDELLVVDRKGRIELLQTSPFATMLDVCLVYLDEAHTRGTDLRLPKFYRAAVTLGANLTKDRLVQGE